jgi:hypothetical protein
MKGRGEDTEAKIPKGKTQSEKDRERSYIRIEKNRNKGRIEGR